MDPNEGLDAQAFNTCVNEGKLLGDITTPELQQIFSGVRFKQTTTPNGAELNPVDCMDTYVTEIMSFQIGRVSICPWFTMVALLITSIQGAYFANLMGPMPEVENSIPDNHMASFLNDLLTSPYHRSDYEPFGVVSHMFDIDDFDISTRDAYDPAQHLGDVIYDRNSNLTTEAAQESLLQFFEYMQGQLCCQDACKNKNYETPMLMMQIVT